VRRPVFAVIAGLFGFLGSTAAAVAEETSATEFAQSAEQGALFKTLRNRLIETACRHK